VCFSHEVREIWAANNSKDFSHFPASNFCIRITLPAKEYQGCWSRCKFNQLQAYFAEHHRELFLALANAFGLQFQIQFSANTQIRVIWEPQLLQPQSNCYKPHGNWLTDTKQL
jgi:hypothetical protein